MKIWCLHTQQLPAQQLEHRSYETFAPVRHSGQVDFLPRVTLRNSSHQVSRGNPGGFVISWVQFSKFKKLFLQSVIGSAKHKQNETWNI